LFLFLSVGVPLYGAAFSLFIRVADTSSSTLTLGDRLTVITTFSALFYAFISFAAAWLLSRWVYGEGPASILGRYRARLARRNDA
jgi:hypothetical protein